MAKRKRPFSIGDMRGIILKNLSLDLEKITESCRYQ
jgi:hypothetical protein